MSGIEGNSPAVRGIVTAPPLPPGTEAQVAGLGLAFVGALVPTAKRGPEEMARVLTELGRLPASAQNAIVALVAQGHANVNPAEAVRTRIAESFPIGSERRHRLGEALALHQGLDPSRLSRTAIESLVVRALATLGPRTSPRPPIQDVLEPSPSYGPFVAVSERTPTVPGVEAVATAPAPMPPPVAPFFQPTPATPAPLQEPPAAAPPSPAPVYYAPPSSGGGKKKKKGLRSSKGAFKPAKALKAKLKKWIKDILPYVAMILQFIPLGWTQIVAAAIRIYLAIKAKNIMGIVAAVASFIPALGAAIGSSALNAVAQVATKVAEIARYAQQAWEAVSAIRKGDWVGGLAGLASGAAGVVGNFSESAASALRGWSADLQVWGQRVSSGMQAIAAARRGDFLGAFGIGANLAADLELVKGQNGGALKEVAEVASRVGAVQKAIRSGDWAGAAGVLSGLAGQYGGDELKTVANTVRQLVTAQRLVKSRDYLGAATIVLRVAGQFPISVETSKELHEMAGRLETVGRAVARGRAGDFAGAAQELWKLGLSAQWDKETREALQRASSAFTRAVGVIDALKSGDRAKASALLAEVVAHLSGESATPELLRRIARRLQDAGGLHEAIRKGDHSKAADILGEILERETTGDTGGGAGGQDTGTGGGEGGESGRGRAQVLRTSFGPAAEDPDPSPTPGRSLEPALEEVIQLLNVWTRTPEGRRILEIIRDLPDSDLNAFLAELKVRGYLQKLFGDLHGAEYQELIRLLASKGARAPLDETAAAQVLQGILGGGAQFGRDLVDGVAALFKLETYVGMAEMSKTLVLAADPGGFLRLFAPQVRNEAIQKLKQILDSARGKIQADWEAAKLQGKEAEIIARWSTQGILEVATFFVGVGEVKTAVNATRLGGVLASGAQRISRLAIEAGGWKDAAAIVGRSRIEGVDELVQALRKFDATGDEQFLRNLKPEQLEAIADALDVHVAGKVGPGELPYVIRYDTGQPGRPDPRWSIDTSAFRSGYATPNGGIVNAREFWKQWLERHPETISPANRRLIQEERRSPRVDEQWVAHFPEHARLLGHSDRERTLHHHHVDHGPVAVPVPGVTHRGSGGPWHDRPTDRYFDW